MRKSTVRSTVKHYTFDSSMTEGRSAAELMVTKVGLTSVKEFWVEYEVEEDNHVRPKGKLMGGVDPETGINSGCYWVTGKKAAE
jgi:hypothetical protein